MTNIRTTSSPHGSPSRHLVRGSGRRTLKCARARGKSPQIVFEDADMEARRRFVLKASRRRARLLGPAAG